MSDAQAFKAGMRRLASGIALVTAEHDGVDHGLAATSVTALTAEPPTLLICINRSASCHDALAAAGRFCVNILSAAHVDLLTTFANSARRGERFVGSQWVRGPTRSPHLATALAAFHCTVARTIEHETHTIFIGRVTEVARDGDGDALVYFDGTAKPLLR